MGICVLGETYAGNVSRSKEAVTCWIEGEAEGMRDAPADVAGAGEGRADDLEGRGVQPSWAPYISGKSSLRPYGSDGAAPRR